MQKENNLDLFAHNMISLHVYISFVRLKERGTWACTTLNIVELNLNL